MHHTITGSQTDWIEICGTGGRILLDPLDEGRVVVETPGGREEFQDTIPEATTLPIIDDFVRAVETGSPTICPAEEALKTNQVIYTGYRSSVEGRSLTVGS
jgi:predicted dehydrogenase